MSNRKERQIELEQLYKTEGGKEKIHTLYYEKVGTVENPDERELTAAEMIGPILDAEFPIREEVEI